jgi:hypothetical protein
MCRTNPLTAQLIENTIGDVIPGCNCPHDLPQCLMDGVVLCRFMNAMYPGKIPVIYGQLWPAPHKRVSSSTLATNLKARKNVDSFLEACRQLGVKSTNMCTALDILQQKDITQLVVCLEELQRTERPEVTNV